jgi:hypothetical protein
MFHVSPPGIIISGIIVRHHANLIGLPDMVAEVIALIVEYSEPFEMLYVLAGGWIMYLVYPIAGVGKIDPA